MIKISPSLIGMLLECPRCLWYHFKKGIIRPTGPFPSLPSGMDRILKDYFDKYRKKGILPPEIDKKINGKLYDNLEKLNIWRNNRKGLSTIFKKYDMQLKGAIDELLIDKKDRFILLDFKTRGYPIKDDTHEHYQSQLDLYALLFQRNKLPLAEHGYLLFFYPHIYKKGKTEFSVELKKMEVSPRRGLALIRKISKIILNRKPKANPDCDYCIYREYK